MYSTQTVSNDNQKPYIEDRKTIQRSKIKDKQESTNGLHRKWILNNKIFTKNMGVNSSTPEEYAPLALLAASAMLFML